MAENIAYGDISETLDMERIEEAGRMANADDFIKNLPNGYYTHLGDRATTLSGGQRQRYSLFIVAFDLWTFVSLLFPSHLLLSIFKICSFTVSLSLTRLDKGRSQF